MGVLRDSEEAGFQRFSRTRYVDRQDEGRLAHDATRQERWNSCGENVESAGKQDKTLWACSETNRREGKVEGRSKPVMVSAKKGVGELKGRGR